MAGDDPAERPPNQRPDPRVAWCEPCRALRVGTTWHPEADSPMCPRCTREWTPAPPLRAHMLSWGDRNLWRMPADGTET